MEENIQNNREKKVSKIDFFKNYINEEINDFKKDEENSLEKYAKVSLKNFHIISIAIASSLILLYIPLNFKFISQIIGLFTLIFAVSVILITKYYLKNKDNEKIKLYIYDCWQKGILSMILVNFGLYAFSTNPHMEMLTILSFATIATIYIQRGVKKSLSLLF
ncbi:hypothetical protein [Arcobacter sp. LA11]|uniref:hypothetical protein n=1 Tax=Arcobacter sp. LA11 TaxID=1898176 RepID=UPI000934EEBD|nr:hypothetical protein [Arcobacter sp. LA11]